MAILYQYPEYYSWFIENLYLVIFYHFFPVVCLPITCTFYLLRRKIGRVDVLTKDKKNKLVGLLASFFNYSLLNRNISQLLYFLYPFIDLEKNNNVT